MPIKKEATTEFSSVSKDFFFAQDAEAGKEIPTAPAFLFSTDSLSGYGLDLTFELVKEAGFEGLDIALWKNFDAWNVEYTKKLSDQYGLPVKVIQVSGNVNEKEMNKALDLCYGLGADTIAINAPTMFNFKAFSYITDNLPRWKKENKAIHFTIINPEDSNIFALPIPKYRFSNIVEIIKKYLCYLGLDISNMDSNSLENDFMRRMKDFLPYISVLYLSDKSRTGEDHVAPGDGTLKLDFLLKKLKEYGYNRYISTKLKLSKADLSDVDKVKLILKRARKFYTENYTEVK
ncbi:MAG: TIM barrel protein [bacterium]